MKRLLPLWALALAVAGVLLIWQAWTTPMGAPLPPSPRPTAESWVRTVVVTRIVMVTVSPTFTPRPLQVIPLPTQTQTP